MKFKFKILYLLLITLVLFSISSVVATDDADIIPEDISQDDDLLEDVQIDESLKEDQTDYSFTSLYNQINEATGDNITLEGTYVYDSQKESYLQNGININKENDFKIIGENLVIDGKNAASVFNINSKATIELINVTIINSYAGENGWAITSYSDNTILRGCNFSSNSIFYGDLKSFNSVLNLGLTVYGNSNFVESDILRTEFYAYNNVTFVGGFVYKLTSYANLTCTDTRIYQLITYNNTILNNVDLETGIQEEYRQGVSLYGNTTINNGIRTYAVYNNGNLEITSDAGEHRIMLINNRNGNVTFNLDPNHNRLKNALLINQDGTGTFTVANGTTCILETAVVEYTDFTNNGGTVEFINCDMGKSNITNINGQMTVHVDLGMGYSLKSIDFINNGGKIDIPYGSSLDNCAFTNNKGIVNIHKSLILKGTLNNFDEMYISEGSLINSKIYNEGTLSLVDEYASGANINNNGTLNILGKANMTNSRLENTGKLNVADSASISGMTIKKVDSIVSVNKVTMNYGATKYISIKITDKEGNPVKNIEFTIKINKKNYSATSNAQGVAKLKVPTINVGTYTISINGKNQFYNIVAKKTTVKVNKAKTTVKVPKSIKKSKKLSITVKSKVTKKVAKSVKIKVKVKGKNIQTQNQQKRSCKTQNQQNNKRKTQTGHHFFKQKLQNKQKNYY